MQLFPTAPSSPDLRSSDFWDTARRSPKARRFRGVGTSLFLITIAGTIAGAGVAALRYGDPDRWDPPAPGAQKATMPADIAPAASGAASMAESLAAPPACIPVVVPAASASASVTTAAKPHGANANTTAKKSTSPPHAKKRPSAEMTPADLPSAN